VLCRPSRAGLRRNGSIVDRGEDGVSGAFETDAGGEFPDIYFDEAQAYRGVLKTSAGATLKGVDPGNYGALRAFLVPGV
jgi:hypothetical protein